jgi:tripartite-type tricarboxylate transporter receptor subunit TctC
LDTLGRVLAQSLQLSLGQPAVVENIAGANGGIGSGHVARAAPDGYTLGLGFWGSHVANGAIYPLSYDVVKDFEPIALLATAPSGGPLSVATSRNQKMVAGPQGREPQSRVSASHDSALAPETGERI